MIRFLYLLYGFCIAGLPVLAEFWLYIVHAPETGGLFLELSRWTAWPAIILYITIVVHTLRDRVQKKLRPILLGFASLLVNYAVILLSPSALPAQEGLFVAHAIVVVTTLLSFILIPFLQPWQISSGTPSVLGSLREKLSLLQKQPIILLGFAVLLLPLVNVAYLLYQSYIFMGSDQHSVVQLLILGGLIVQGTIAQWYFVKNI